LGNANRLPRQLYFEPLSDVSTGGPDASSVLRMLIPGKMLKPFQVAAGARTFTIPGIGLAAIFIDFVLALERTLPSIRAEELRTLSSATTALLFACLGHTTGEAAEDLRLLDDTKLKRAMDFIRENLHSPNFGSKELGQLIGVSRSNLYRMFKPLGGVRRYIHRQRLLLAYTLLCDPDNSTPIFKIAEKLCFFDASSFSRAFKHEFGRSPKTVRADALSGNR
jgi:AraC-like DNA-binding protein